MTLSTQNKHSTSKEICSVLYALGRNGKIRTCDLYHPKVALYQTELRPENGYM